MSEKKSDSLILVDGSSYLYRAYHASERADLRTSSGYPTGAINVFIRMLKKLTTEYVDNCIVVVFDAKGKNFRHEMYPEYKATRSVMPEDLQQQIEPIQRFIKAWGLVLLMVEGVEADDVLGTLAKKASEHNISTLIVTGDKDLAQLVDDRITLADTMKKTRTGPQEVKDKFGIPPELIIDYLALAGDQSDNIPGMSGVGPKTAVALLSDIGGLDKIEQHLKQGGELNFRGSGKFTEKFWKEQHNIKLSKELATIRTDIELPVEINQLSRAEKNTEELLVFCQEYELTLLEKELTINKKKQEETEMQYELITKEETFLYWVKKLRESRIFGFDTQNTSIDYMTAEIIGISFAISSGEAAYIPLGHVYEGVEQLSLKIVLEGLKPILEDFEKIKVGRNVKYNKNILARYGIELKGIIFDTMLESHVLNSTGTKHDLESLAWRFLKFNTIQLETIVGKGAKKVTFSKVPIDKALPYMTENVDITLRLHKILWKKLQQETSLKKVFENIEVPLIPVLSRIERAGVLVDSSLLEEQNAELVERLFVLKEDAWAVAGERFNLESTKELGEILFSKMGLPVLKKTPKGQPSTKEEVLQELAINYPLPKLLLEYRSLNKLKNTYTETLPNMVNVKTGRIHTTYHQSGTVTGRLSSTNPNLQNIPVKTEEGRRIRQAFVSPKGYQIVSADYSQVELRIMAHLSEDEGLLEAFANNMDVHQVTAAEVFGVLLEEVVDEQRRSAKAINFGLIYGMSAFGLSKQLGIARHAAQEYIDIYFERYPGVLSYMNRIKAYASEHGYVETLFGRRLYLPDIQAQNSIKRQASERIAINAPMQGTAADIIKLAMVRMDSWLTENKLDGRIILQVHDELVLEVSNDDLEVVTNGIESVMGEVAELKVPLLLNIGIGNSWEEAH